MMRTFFSSRHPNIFPEFKGSPEMKLQVLPAHLRWYPISMLKFLISNQRIYPMKKNITFLRIEYQHSSFPVKSNKIRGERVISCFEETGWKNLFSLIFWIDWLWFLSSIYPFPIYTHHLAKKLISEPHINWKNFLEDIIIWISKSEWTISVHIPKPWQVNWLCDLRPIKSAGWKKNRRILISIIKSLEFYGSL